MIRHLDIVGLGPHEDTALHFADPMGVTSVQGASEVGKSTLIDAVAFVLWGMDRKGRALDLRAMRDDADEVRVELELASGSRMIRTLRRSKGGGRGKSTRVLVNGDGERDYRTEKDWLGALKGLGASPRALLHVLVPHAWATLVEGEGGGRPFRDLLADILPKADKAAIVAELLEAAGFDFRRGDPVNVRDAEELRRRAKSDRERQCGDVDRLGMLIDTAEAEESPPSLKDPEKWRAVLEVAAAWAAFDTLADAHVEREEFAARVATSAEEWDARNAELGDRPAGKEGAVKAAKGRLEVARTRRRNEEADLVLRRAQHGRFLAELQLLKDEPGMIDSSFDEDIAQAYAALQAADAARDAMTDICPTCDRDGWEGARAATEDARDHAAEAHADALKTKRHVEIATIAEDAERDGKLTAQLMGIDRDIETLEASMKRLDDDVGRAEAEVAAALEGNAPGLEWDRAAHALGKRPEIPDVSEAPTAPDVGRQHPSHVDEARTYVENYDRSQGALEQRTGDLVKLRAQLSASEGRLDELCDEVDRLEALVDAVRRAPSLAARRQLDVLGDLGPVELVLPDAGGAEVLVDSRPYHLASTGRLVVADVWLRAGLRRALGVGYLPLFVDCVQDVGGMEIPSAAPAIFLRTTDEDGLEVSS